MLKVQTTYYLVSVYSNVRWRSSETLITTENIVVYTLRTSGMCKRSARFTGSRRHYIRGVAYQVYCNKRSLCVKSFAS